MVFNWILQCKKREKIVSNYRNIFVQQWYFCGIFVAKQGNLQVFLSFFVAFQVILMRSKTSKIVLKQDISTHRIFISFLYHYPIVLNSMDKTKQITSFLKPCGLAPKSPIVSGRKPHTFRAQLKYFYRGYIILTRLKKLQKKPESFAFGLLVISKIYIVSYNK